MADKYDDLDDLLDEFEEQDRILNAPPGSANLGGASIKELDASASKPAVPATAPKVVDEPGVSSNEDKELNEAAERLAKLLTPQAEKDELTVPELDEEFAKQLQSGMDDLVSEMSDDPEARKAFEELMAGLTGQNPGDVFNAAGVKDKPAAPVSFQDTIAATMNRLNENQSSPGPSDDAFLEKMLKELQDAAGSGAGAGGMDGLLSSLMEELSSKDILYEPMKEMHDKFPGWLNEHGPKISAEELQRYKDQQRIVEDIVLKFEEMTYSDDDKACRKYISAKMEAMQATGAPPPELVGDLADGAIPGGIPGAGPSDCGVQ
ncbi:Peroxisome biogenesis protein 19-1 [Wickerhamiella sorbophila]|uniref:Peroxisome biogenesis protein 19-1 n=1 Tax=Wickerhamiella sorbophila TaxID=45607 RepID=A0A2T0FEB7_9ASCO|nr:Peroxisome biogenesis protein 19-1 [Wickerhamiella sorbophila]PRT53343.1 Peroxisome biogenesis protein 19-1 [Wickerhamiella sorbophila]